MKVLIVGSGGREHALAWKCAQSPQSPKYWSRPATAAPPPSRACATSTSRPRTSPGSSRSRRPNGSASPSSGPRRRWSPASSMRSAAAGLRCFGPRKAAAQLEGSKAFTKEFLKRHGIPDRGLRHVHARDLRSEPGCARSARRSSSRPSGLAAGKGVSSPTRADEAIASALSHVRRPVRRRGRSSRHRGIPAGRGSELHRHGRRQEHRSRSRPRRTTSACRTRTRARTPAAWARTRRRRWSTPRCTSASCARSSSRPSAGSRRTARPTPASCTPASWCIPTARRTCSSTTAASAIRRRSRS